MSVIVRRATINDARTIADFALKLFSQHRNYDYKRFARLADNEGAEWFYGNQIKKADARVLVVEIEGKIVGFAYIEYEAINYTDLLENAARLHDIYIKESSRELGTGKLLIEKSIEAAKELGADKLLLSVATKNEFAREFFERNGFRITMVEMMLDLTIEK